MKKLLYLLPFVLIGLNFVALPLYKDKVDFGASLDSLSPSYSFWKLKDLSLDFSGSVDLSGNSSSQSNQSQHLYQGAKFYGFPFGAYLTSGSSTNTASSSSSSSISAYSLLWAPVDALIVLAGLVFSFKINRPSKNGAVNNLPQTQPSNTMPSVPPSSAVYPSAPPAPVTEGVNSNGVIVPSPQTVSPQPQPVQPDSSGQLPPVQLPPPQVG